MKYFLGVDGKYPLVLIISSPDLKLFWPSVCLSVGLSFKVCMFMVYKENFLILLSEEIGPSSFSGNFKFI